MQKIKRILGSILAVCILFTSVESCVVGAFAAEFSKIGGWNESVYIEWTDTNPESAVIEYKHSSESDYKTADKELIRDYGGKARVDIPGLSPGNYDVKVTTSNGNIIIGTNIEVKSYDRSGYAHFNYTDGVGAYKDNGILKDNAVVLYVTDENKDTIELPFPNDPSHIVKGIGNILNSRGAVGSSEGATNTNDGILLEYSKAGIPIDVRIIGKVNVPMGLTAYNSKDYGGTNGDNGCMARMKDAKNVTIEGIGYDASIYGWGIHFMASSAYLEYGKSFEVRNLTFESYPEDALGMEGIQTGSILTAPVERCWIHNNSFLPGYCANPAESDKAEGDGSCDFKRGKYYTMSYCYYYGCHKTNLIGASDSNYQFNLTFHHNWWKNCASRGPLLRQANMHIYNNYYDGNTSKTMDTRANSYTLSESNYFDGCKNPITTKSGSVVKSFGDIFYNYGGSMMGTVVSDREAVVKNNCTYSDFDTNPSIFYFNPLSKQSDCYITNAVTAKAECIAYSGVMKENPSEPDISPVITANPKTAITYPYSIEYTPDDAGVRMTESGITNLRGTDIEFENVLYNLSSDYKTTSTNMKSKGSGVIVFKLDTPAKVTIMCANNGKYGITLTDNYGTPYAKASVGGSASANVEAGIYAIQAELTEKEAYFSGFSVEAIGEIESSSETTTASTVELGTYKIGTAQTGDNDCVDLTGEFGNIYYDLNTIESNYGTINNNSDSGISFSVSKSCNLTLNTGDNPVEITAISGRVNNKASETVVAGNNTVNLTAGLYSISGTSTENSKIYSLIFSEYFIPETTTETTSEITTVSTPVELGSQSSGDDDNCSIKDNGDGTYTLLDNSSSAACTWTIPFSSQNKGKIVISGTAIPSTSSGKWAFVQIKGIKSDGTVGEICSFASDSNKILSLRDGSGIYHSLNQGIAGGKNYDYVFIIDLNSKFAQLTVNKSLNAICSIDAESIDSIFMQTAVSATDRTLTATLPYVGIVESSIETTTSEITTETVTEATTESITVDYSYSEYVLNPSDFAGITEVSQNIQKGTGNFFTLTATSSKIVKLTDTEIRLQGTGSPEFRSILFNMPVSGTVTVIAKSGSNSAVRELGLFTGDDYSRQVGSILCDSSITPKTVKITEPGKYMLVSTNAGINIGEIVVKLNNAVTETTTETVSSETTTETTTDAPPVGPTETTEMTTDAETSTEVTTDESTEGTTETTTEKHNIGDTDNDNIISIKDCSNLLNYILTDIKTKEMEKAENFVKEFDVNLDGDINSADVAILLQKALDDSYVMPCEKLK